MANRSFKGREPQHYYTALGKTLTLREWAEEPYCACSYDLLRKRVQERSWELVKALRTPPRERRPKERPKPKGKSKPLGTQVSAWGMTMNLRQWSLQTYVSVSHPTLWRRIVRDGWPPQKALMHQPGEPLEEKVAPSPWDMSLGEYLKRGLEKHRKPSER